MNRIPRPRTRLYWLGRQSGWDDVSSLPVITDTFVGAGKAQYMRTLTVGEHDVVEYWYELYPPVMEPLPAPAPIASEPKKEATPKPEAPEPQETNKG